MTYKVTVNADDLNIVVNGAFGSQFQSQYHERLRAALAEQVPPPKRYRSECNDTKWEVFDGPTVLVSFNAATPRAEWFARCIVDDLNGDTIVFGGTPA